MFDAVQRTTVHLLLLNEFKFGWSLFVYVTVPIHVFCECYLVRQVRLVEFLCNCFVTVMIVYTVT